MKGERGDAAAFSSHTLPPLWSLRLAALRSPIPRQDLLTELEIGRRNETDDSILFGLPPALIRLLDDREGRFLLERKLVVRCSSVRVQSSGGAGCVCTRTGQPFAANRALSGSTAPYHDILRRKISGTNRTWSRSARSSHTTSLRWRPWQGERAGRGSPRRRGPPRAVPRRGTASAREELHSRHTSQRSVMRR